MDDHYLGRLVSHPRKGLSPLKILIAHFLPGKTELATSHGVWVEKSRVTTSGLLYILHGIGSTEGKIFFCNGEDFSPKRFALYYHHIISVDQSCQPLGPCTYATRSNIG
ncbi:hypothetical protein K439DRAFT_218298 [Ramaria rubella]|nr:hypothetical protein K439DRAFT_218298 [Ramaria rubella]